MNPSFLEENDGSAKPPALRRWYSFLRPIGKLFRFVSRILFYKPLRRRLRVDDGISPIARFIRGVLYRLAFVPFLIAIAVVAMVYAGTHPQPAASELDPTCQGIYYDAVTLNTDDGVKLDAWLVPVVDASVVLTQRDEVLRHKQPAVILVHDFGQRRQQMLPLVRPLHQAGFVVLVIGLRASGPMGGVSSTFGVKEALDIKAGVTMLRRRPFINGDRIGVVGIGTGASAAILAAREDPTIAALVLDHPSRDAAEIVSDRLVPHHPMLQWMAPLCKWTFEMTYQVDIDELDLSRLTGVLKSRPVLMLDAPEHEISSGRAVFAVRDFLRANLRTNPAAASAR
jgi:hypothetical protein